MNEFYIMKKAHRRYLFLHIWNEWKRQSHPTREKITNRMINVPFLSTSQTKGLEGAWPKNNIKINQAHPFAGNVLQQDNLAIQQIL